MKQFIILLIVFISHKASALVVDATNPLISYSGRWDHANLHAPAITWPGSMVSIRFKGSEITAHITVDTQPEQFRVVINGKPAATAITVSPNTSSYLLATGLDSTTPTTIDLFKETYHGGITTFKGFTIPKGNLYSIERKPRKKILFLGDSNMNGTSLYSEKDKGYMGSYYAYPATIARMFDADFHLLANGSATLKDNNGNSVYNFISAQHLERDGELKLQWFQPDLIVVNAGANDIEQIKSTAALHVRYLDVITKLRKHYGQKPHIILYNAYGWHLDEPANTLHELLYEPLKNISIQLYPWMWEQWHGGMVEHAGQARLLAQHIQALNIGFHPQQLPEVFDGFGHNFNVANGSFEDAALAGYNSFGWRYHENGAQRIFDKHTAYDGDFFVRLQPGQNIHQGTDATGDFQPGGTKKLQSYKITAMIKSSSKNAVAELGADFEGQALYNRKGYQSVSFKPSQQWQQFSATFTAPIGTWKTYITLKSQQGSIDFDQIHMQGL